MASLGRCANPWHAYAGHHRLTRQRVMHWRKSSDARSSPSATSYQPDILTPEQAVTMAMAHNGAPVVLADSADNAGAGQQAIPPSYSRPCSTSGCPLRRLARSGIRCGRYMFSGWVGSTLPCASAARWAPVRDTVDVTATVTHLKHGATMCGLSGSVAPLGMSRRGSRSTMCMW